MATPAAGRGAESFSRRIADFVGTGDVVLFPGAGCSARLKIPVCAEYLSALAVEAEEKA